MAILLAAAAAIGWGAADYFGGDASRRAVPVFVVVAIAELLGGLLLAPVLIARGTPPPGDPRLILAGVAGLAVTVELGLIYRALSRGEAFITAPIGALGAAAAVTVGLVGGDPISLALAIGLVCALVGGAITSFSSADGAPRRRTDAWRATATCLAAGAAVGTSLVSLHAVGRLDPYWGTATEHVSTAVSAAAAALVVARGPVRELAPGWSQMPGVALVAASGVGGDLAYVSASHTGALSILSAISSLYPVTTIALGRVLQAQRATRVQLAGVLIALGGAVLLGAAAR
ncbi:MAG: EamA family transporter [Solirubrobacterales bacterium]|nr:EamA family transporter [Solirubrobacterales bacterium]